MNQHHSGAHSHQQHRAHDAHHPHHGHNPHHKKKIKVFHPNKKTWMVLATLALTVGMAIGESYLPSEAIQPFTAIKMSQEMQTSSFNFVETSKRGVMRATYRVSFLDVKSINPLVKIDEPAKSGIKRVCFWEDELEDPTYTAEMVEVRITEDIQPGEAFRVEIDVTNTGDVTWYGAGSDCLKKTIVNLGTQKEMDRASEFFHEGATTGWIGNNRVKMVNDAVKSGEMATFAFTAIAPEKEGIYKEWLGVVAENVTWFNDFEIGLEIPVGEVTEEDEYKAQFMNDVSINTRDLEGEESIEVDLSDQEMRLKFGDQITHRMTISSGAADTPTPQGTWNILNKQELRIGGAWPHYRMPYWQGFTSVGHGLHALPYLESDGGVFWSEALTHIGIPVSHGCIRMLPDDAVLVYGFGEVGMELHVQS